MKLFSISILFIWAVGFTAQANPICDSILEGGVKLFNEPFENYKYALEIKESTSGNLCENQDLVFAILRDNESAISGAIEHFKDGMFDCGSDQKFSAWLDKSTSLQASILDQKNLALDYLKANCVKY